jgi:hypothetical protein
MLALKNLGEFVEVWYFTVTVFCFREGHLHEDESSVGFGFVLGLRQCF